MTFRALPHQLYRLQVLGKLFAGIYSQFVHTLKSTTRNVRTILDFSTFRESGVTKSNARSTSTAFHGPRADERDTPHAAADNHLVHTHLQGSTVMPPRDKASRSRTGQRQADNEHQPKMWARACAVCRAKKIRCDALQPRCTSCVNAGRACSYRRETPRKRSVASAVRAT